MAILRGEQGAVQFDAAGSSNATIVGTRSWTLNITKDTLDVTDHGDTFRAFVGSMISVVLARSSWCTTLMQPVKQRLLKTLLLLRTLQTPRLSCLPPAPPLVLTL